MHVYQHTPCYIATREMFSVNLRLKSESRPQSSSVRCPHTINQSIAHNKSITRVRPLWNKPVSKVNVGPQPPCFLATKLENERWLFHRNQKCCALHVKRVDHEEARLGDLQLDFTPALLQFPTRSCTTTLCNNSSARERPSRLRLRNLQFTRLAHQ